MANRTEAEVVKNYPSIKWDTIGLPPLRIALLTCVVATAIGGIFSNPLFQWANSAVIGTPLLKDSLTIAIKGNIG